MAVEFLVLDEHAEERPLRVEVISARPTAIDADARVEVPTGTRIMGWAGSGHVGACGRPRWRRVVCSAIRPRIRSVLGVNPAPPGTVRAQMDFSDFEYAT